MEEPVYLRALEIEDLERTYKWHNDAGLYLSLTGTFRHVSMCTERKWLEKKVEYNNSEVNLAICETKSKEHMGNIYLRGIDWISRHAKLGLFIGEKSLQSKGYGQSAVRQLVRYAFNELNLRKLSLGVFADNEVAKHVYEKCGFRVEGTLKHHVYKNGEYKDLICMALFREE